MVYETSWSLESNCCYFIYTDTCFVCTLFAYMGTSERVSVFHPEQTHSYAYLTDFEKTLEYDETAPAGVVKVYRSVLAPELSKESCLVFNIAHHNIDVYFEDVLVYRLTGAEGNRIGTETSAATGAPSMSDRSMTVKR